MFFFIVVVICLKIRTFVVATTTFICFLQTKMGCDLLENTYLCGSNNNKRVQRYGCYMVVICLKIRTFVVATTTGTEVRSSINSCDLLENTYLCGSNNNTQHAQYHCA